MKLKVNSTLGKLFVTSLGSNNLSIINTADLTLSATSLDVGVTTDAVASATNSNGTALFVVSPSNNSIKVYQFNNITPSSSTQIASTVTPPSASASLSSSDVISGSLEECDAGVLSDGKIVAIFSESSSEMGYIQVSSDLSTLTTGRILLPSAQGSMGIRILNNDSGNASVAYIAAPGGSAISMVNLNTSIYLGLIN